MAADQQMINAETAHQLLTSRIFDGSPKDHQSTVTWAHLTIGPNTTHVPRIRFSPYPDENDQQFEVLGITAEIGTILGVDARLWPQGANSGAAIRWLNAHRDTGDMTMVIANGVFVHGTVSESPVEIEVGDGGPVAWIVQLLRTLALGRRTALVTAVHSHETDRTFWPPFWLSWDSLANLSDKTSVRFIARRCSLRPFLT